jgi:23S rRNA U2552 (ribose-2'-O)-methylase RlmE/FtsJ
MYVNGARSAGMNFFERHSRETVSSGTVTINCCGAPGGLSAIIQQQLHSQIIIVFIDSNQGSTHENNTTLRSKF